MIQQARRIIRIVYVLGILALTSCSRSSEADEVAELRDSVANFNRIFLKYIEVSKCHLNMMKDLHSTYYRLDMDLQNLVIEFADTSLIGKESQADLLMRSAKFNGRYRARLDQIIKNTEHRYLQADAKAAARLQFIPRVYSYDSRKVNSLKTYLDSYKRHLAVLDMNSYPTSDDWCYKNFPEHQEVRDLYLKAFYDEAAAAGNNGQ